MNSSNNLETKLILKNTTPNYLKKKKKAHQVNEKTLGKTRKRRPGCWDISESTVVWTMLLPHKPTHGGSGEHPSLSDTLLPRQCHLMTSTLSAASPSANETRHSKILLLPNSNFTNFQCCTWQKSTTTNICFKTVLSDRKCQYIVVYEAINCSF